MRILKEYQKGGIVLYWCKTSSFTESGFTKNDTFRSLEELCAVMAFPHPNIHFHAVYIHSSTGKYAFEISTDTVANTLWIMTDSKLAEKVEREIRESRTAEQM